MNSLPPEHVEDNLSPAELHDAELEACYAMYGEPAFYVHRPLDETVSHKFQPPEECDAWISFLFTEDRRIICVTTDPTGTSTGEVDVDFYEHNKGPYQQFWMEDFVLEHYRVR